MEIGAAMAIAVLAALLLGGKGKSRKHGKSRKRKRKGSRKGRKH